MRVHDQNIADGSMRASPTQRALDQRSERPIPQAVSIRHDGFSELGFSGGVGDDWCVKTARATHRLTELIMNNATVAMLPGTHCSPGTCPETTQPPESVLASTAAAACTRVCARAPAHLGICSDHGVHPYPPAHTWNTPPMVGENQVKQPADPSHALPYAASHRAVHLQLPRASRSLLNPLALSLSRRVARDVECRPHAEGDACAPKMAPASPAPYLCSASSNEKRIVPRRCVLRLASDAKGSGVQDVCNAHTAYCAGYSEGERIRFIQHLSILPMHVLATVHSPERPALTLQQLP